MNSGSLIQKSILVIIFFLLISNLQAQPVDIDTTKVADIETEEVHSPKKAAIFSAILPGLGQAYNKKYWKIPIVYIGFGAIVYFIDWNNGNYQFYKAAYKHLTDDDPLTTDYNKIDAVKYFDLENNQTHFNNFKDGLIKQQNYNRRNRDLLIISMFGFYALNIIDASVDAHLYNFDISDDLTFNWQPSMLSINNQYVYCINCTFNF